MRVRVQQLVIHNTEQLCITFPPNLHHSCLLEGAIKLACSDLRMTLAVTATYVRLLLNGLRLLLFLIKLSFWAIVLP